MKSVEDLDQKVAANVEQDGEGSVVAGEGTALTNRVGEAQNLTPSELQELDRAITNAWSRPGGTHEDDEVLLKIRIQPDGTVVDARVIDKDDRMARDPAYRAFAESAVRAVFRASPLPIPNGKYALLNATPIYFSP